MRKRLHWNHEPKDNWGWGVVVFRTHITIWLGPLVVWFYPLGFRWR
jgi:hypothetical protein